MKTTTPPRAVHLSAESELGLRNRLRRLGGQVSGLERMLDQRRSCDELLVQIAALRQAAGSMATAVLHAQIESCEAALGASEEARRSLADLKGALGRVVRHG
jgi:DNA-binding FrmR family transcriptional regulator